MGGIMHELISASCTVGEVYSEAKCITPCILWNSPCCLPAAIFPFLSLNCDGLSWAHLQPQ